jgi:hypothetical protein
MAGNIEAHGRNAVLLFDDIAGDGTLTKFSCDLEQITANFTREVPETTRMCDTTRSYSSSGLKEFSIDINGFWVGLTASNAACAIKHYYDEETSFLVQLAPAGCLASYPLWSASMIVTDMSFDIPGQEMVKMTATLNIFDGSVTTGAVTV